jgi:hypothetical protein
LYGISVCVLSSDDWTGLGKRRFSRIVLFTRHHCDEHSGQRNDAEDDPTLIGAGSTSWVSMYGRRARAEKLFERGLYLTHAEITMLHIWFEHALQQSDDIRVE